MLDKYFEYNEIDLNEIKDNITLDHKFPSFYFTGKWDFGNELYITESSTIFYIYKNRVKVLNDNKQSELKIDIEFFLDEFYRCIKKYNIKSPIIFYYEAGKVLQKIEYRSPLCAVAVIPSTLYERSGANYLKKEYLRKTSNIEKREINLKEDIPSLRYPFKKDFKKNMKEIKKAITEGYTYQINYTERIFFKTKNTPKEFFKKIKDDRFNYNSYFTVNTSRVIISNSPERLVSIDEDSIRSEPIKGTVSKSEENYLKVLKNSSKDNRELAMIVDLLRNDISAIVKKDSLKWECPLVMDLPNICHLYGIVKGILRKDIPMSQIIKSIFPGGSITGVPKRMTMKIIDDLERFPREIYTGSVGLLGPNMSDLNILIRSFYFKKGEYIYGSGGGITYWSDSDNEWDELILKSNKIKHFI